MMRADPHEDAIGDAAAHFERARTAGGQPDRYGTVEGQIRRPFGADLDLLASQELAHENNRVLHLGDPCRAQAAQANGGVAGAEAERDSAGRKFVDRRD